MEDVRGIMDDGQIADYIVHLPIYIFYFWRAYPVLSVSAVLLSIIFR
jgi:hypothetical protein